MIVVVSSFSVKDQGLKQLQKAWRTIIKVREVVYSVGKLYSILVHMRMHAEELCEKRVHTQMYSPAVRDIQARKGESGSSRSAIIIVILHQEKLGSRTSELWLME